MRLLSDNATVVISGTRIAEELGTTRSEVWRAVQHLRELGLQIIGHPATGYQMETVPDLLLPDILSPLIKGTIFGSRIHHYFSIGSTNVTAMKAEAMASRKAPSSSPRSRLADVDEPGTAGSRRSQWASTARWCCGQFCRRRTPWCYL